MVRPTKFKISTTSEQLVSHSGLALAGQLLQATDLRARLDALAVPGKPKPGTPHADVLLAMIGLLCLGKSDFADIEAFRKDPFFPKALGLTVVPSEPTLRQRLQEFGPLPLEILGEENARLIKAHAPGIRPCFKTWVALDVDVSPFDNSNTKKEGVAFTYKKVDGYAPIFAYLGEEGYLVLCQLRQGDQHCQKGTPEFLREAILKAKTVTDERLLLRLDAGNDAEENLKVCRQKKTRADFIIKRNLRKESKDVWLADAQADGEWREPREGKRVYIGDTWRECGSRQERIIFKVTERESKADGQRLLLPEIEVETYWTSLGPRQATPDEVIELYHQHGTSEQFHSEIKTDLDLERLPSGKFAVNELVLTCGLVAYNILRLIGQSALDENRNLPPEKQMPIRKAVQRRRLRSVIQDLMYLASRLVHHARGWVLKLPELSPWQSVWQRVHLRFG